MILANAENERKDVPIAFSALKSLKDVLPHSALRLVLVKRKPPFLSSALSVAALLSRPCLNVSSKLHS